MEMTAFAALFAMLGTLLIGAISPGPSFVFVVRVAVVVLRQIDTELAGAPIAPEEIGIRHGEVVEEEFTTSKNFISNFEQFHQVGRSELLYALFGTRNIADARRGVETC